jgi:hypothetical protein
MHSYNTCNGVVKKHFQFSGKTKRTELEKQIQNQHIMKRYQISDLV